MLGESISASYCESFRPLIGVPSFFMTASWPSGPLLTIAEFWSARMDPAGESAACTPAAKASVIRSAVRHGARIKSLILLRRSRELLIDRRSTERDKLLINVRFFLEDPI